MSQASKNSNPAERVLSYFSGLFRKLSEIKDSPHAIAGGVAIGIFFGFTPLFGLKTLLCLGAAFVFRCNPLAAVITVCLHDVVTPFWPFLLRLEYDLGYWLLSQPHAFPPRLEGVKIHPKEFLHWTTFFHTGLPLLVGSLFLAVPSALIAYVATRIIAEKRTAKNFPQDSAEH